MTLIQEISKLETEDEALQLVLRRGVEEGHVLVLVSSDLSAHMVVIQREVENGDGEDMDGTAMSERGKSLTPG